RLKEDAAGRWQEYVTDSSGSARHKASGGGSFQVLARMEGYQPQGEQVAVTAGVPSRLDLYLRKDRPRIDLTLLVLEQGKRQPVTGARVKVSQLQGFSQDGVTGPKGVYETLLPAEGTFTVAVSHPDYELSRQDFALVRGNNQRTIILTRKTPATRLILHVVE